MAKEQRLIHYSGMVQGVGFRYTAYHLARQYDVTGYVRNLEDGRVELLIEGAVGDIDSFLADLRRRMGSYIHKVTQQVSPHTGQYREFSIEH